MSVLTDFTDKIIQRFPPSFRWDEAQKQSWTDDMVEELGGFSEEVLMRALRELIRRRKVEKTPLVSECIAACEEAKRWIDAEKKSNSLPMGVGPITDEMQWNERKRLADTLVKCDLGRRAAREGWLGAMHAYAVKNGRLPRENEFGAVKQQAREFDQAYADVVRGEYVAAKTGEVQKMNNLRPILEKLGSNMLSNRQDLERMVGK